MRALYCLISARLVVFFEPVYGLAFAREISSVKPMSISRLSTALRLSASPTAINAGSCDRKASTWFA